MSGTLDPPCMATKLNLRREVTSALVADGFVRGKRVHVKRVDDEWSLLVDTGEIGKKQGIAPVIGIRHDRGERRLRERRDLPALAAAALARHAPGQGRGRARRHPRGPDPAVRV